MNRCLTALTAVALVACSSLTSAEKAERDAKTAQAVEKALTERQYTVSIQMMYPRGGKTVNVSPDFSLQVKGDTLVSYLPYFGRVYSVPYGGGNGLNFTAPIKEYQFEKDEKGNAHILIRVYTAEDNFTYSLNVFTNGSTSIDVSAREREAISYSGQMELY